ncbi:NAC domain containing protein 50 [Linum perenne]
MEQTQQQQSQTSDFMLLPGFRFTPTEQQLVGFYLFKHISGVSLQNISFCPIAFCDLYGSKEPWEIWSEAQPTSLGLSTGDVYLITELKKATAKGSKIARGVGTTGGRWHETGKDDGFKVHHESQDLAGIRRTFYYHNPNSTEHKCWTVHEFAISFDGGTTFSQDVICLLRNNGSNLAPQPNSRKKRKFSDCTGAATSLPPKVPQVCNATSASHPELIGECDDILLYNSCPMNPKVSAATSALIGECDDILLYKSCPMNLKVSAATSASHPELIGECDDILLYNSCPVNPKVSAATSASHPELIGECDDDFFNFDDFPYLPFSDSSVRLQRFCNVTKVYGFIKEMASHTSGISSLKNQEGLETGLPELDCESSPSLNQEGFYKDSVKSELDSLKMAGRFTSRARRSLHFRCQQPHVTRVRTSHEKKVQLILFRHATMWKCPQQDLKITSFTAPCSTRNSATTENRWSESARMTTEDQSHGRGLICDTAQEFFCDSLGEPCKEAETYSLRGSYRPRGHAHRFEG